MIVDTEETLTKFNEIVFRICGFYRLDRTYWNDASQEAYLYILNRKGVVDLKDKYIYGDIKNGIINFAKGIWKNEYSELTDNIIYKCHVTDDSGKVAIIDLEDKLLDYEYGYLFILHYLDDISVKDLSNRYNITENKIYYELIKIKEHLMGVNK